MSRFGSVRRSPRISLALAIAFTLIVIGLFAGLPELRSAVSWLLVAGPIGWVAKQYPNETKLVAARVFGWFAKYNKRAELEAVRQDLEGTISLGVEQLRAQCPEAAVAQFRLDYIRSEEAVERLPDGTLVIGVAEHHDRVRNLVTATYALVRHGVIPRARPYLDPEVSQAIDFVLTKAILSSTERSAVSDFLTTVWSPAVLGRDRLRELTDKLSELQHSGFLAPVVLSEFQDLATQVGERFPTEALAEETARFVDYLYALATRKPGELLGEASNFEGQTIRCRVVFVPTADVYSQKGPRPYREAVEWSIDNAFHHLYLLASGSRIEQLRQVVLPYRSDGRVRDVVEFLGVRPNLRGRPMRQLIVRLAFDVRYFVGIGQRPLVAIGPGRPRVVNSRAVGGSGSRTA